MRIAYAGNSVGDLNSPIWTTLLPQPGNGTRSIRRATQHRICRGFDRVSAEPRWRLNGSSCSVESSFPAPPRPEIPVVIIAKTMKRNQWAATRYSWTPSERMDEEESWLRLVPDPPGPVALRHRFIENFSRLRLAITPMDMARRACRNRAPLCQQRALAAAGQKWPGSLTTVNIRDIPSRITNDQRD